ncbi:MAG: hypothetical protein CL606_05910 [Anaerolineaceae bacterium]|nr:hypothetical protein [Anaerolineaceae bacterium]|tara:strand:- start:120 stop:587 length:468 start_codon:yes stop_codon:yes gene_type:complete
MWFFVLLASTIIVIVAGIKFSIWCTDKLTYIIVTQRFQDAEFIVNHNKAPHDWTEGRSIIVDLVQGTLTSRARYALSGLFNAQSYEAQRKGYLIQCLDNTTRYFYKCPFFQDEESRQTLTNGLEEEKIRWNQKPLSRIIDPSCQQNLPYHDHKSG